MNQLLKNMYIVLIFSALVGAFCLSGFENNGQENEKFNSAQCYMFYIDEFSNGINFFNFSQYIPNNLPNLTISALGGIIGYLQYFELSVRNGELYYSDLVDKELPLRDHSDTLMHKFALNDEEFNNAIDMRRVYVTSYAQQLTAEVIKNYLQNMHNAHSSGAAVSELICSQLDIVLKKHKKIFDVYAVDKHKIEVMGDFLSKKANIQEVDTVFEKCEDFQKHFYSASTLPQ